ncbi:LacI family DNA-binding transcriptional regulator [Cryobacterium glucosi]|uniref:LacI family transcriptional regulator n=1 Tax=Cryobacterium glucosi TaxID=1259175 RepID=A0ABY2IQ68_9MICO|nr:LacI family DNA-binding transcriptional regulator [Cryobacterium glucosi]TFC21131.1 LacI family transcriptional regulator [Cryobacterium glucosi]
MSTENARGPGGRSTVPNISDVAERAGVAIGTVSNVLNQPHKVTEATRVKVQAAIDELGFVRNRAARALAAGTSNTIGFVIIDLSNSFFLDMARGAEDEAEKAGMTVLLANSDLKDSKQTVYMNLFSEDRVAGILLAPIPNSFLVIDSAKAHNRRVVLLNDSLEAADSCCVMANNEHGGYLAAKHLIDLGRRNLVFAGGPDTLTPVHDRHMGAKRAVAETNGAVRLEYLPTREVTVVDGRRIGHAISSRSRARIPDGIIAAADLLALGIMQSILSETDIRVPEQIALIGYDNNRSAWDSHIPISTLSQPGFEMGRVATQLLLEEIRSPETHTHRRIILEPSLIARESTIGR